MMGMVTISIMEHMHIMSTQPIRRSQKEAAAVLEVSYQSLLSRAAAFAL